VDSRKQGQLEWTEESEQKGDFFFVISTVKFLSLVMDIQPLFPLELNELII
jgi:hypothetical protein